MSTNHNRIRVADLETNKSNKILITNEKGELEFNDVNNLQTEKYNALDCTTEGKALDARQGKVLKDMIDNVGTVSLESKEDVSNKSKDIINDSSSHIKYPSVKAVFNWVLTNFRLKGQNITQAPNTTYTLQFHDINQTIVCSSDLPTTFIIPTQENVAFETGHTVKFIQTGNGPVTLAGEGINFITNQSLTSTKGETRILTRLYKNGWSVEGHVSLEKDLKLKAYSSTRNDGQLTTNKVLSTDENGNLKLYTIDVSNNSTSADSDTYIPTLDNILNVTGATLLTANYTKTGNIVNVMVALTASPKSLSLDTEIGISLPSNRSLSTGLLSGLAVGSTVDGVNFSALVYATSPSTASIKYKLNTRGFSNIVANFSYAIN